MENNKDCLLKDLHFTKSINGHTLEVKEYNGKRVVTFKDIDTVHERPEGTARKRFNDNKKWFIEGEDYFRISPSVFRTAFGEMDKRQQNGVVLVTESGYLMVIKSFHDDLSWQLQRILVNAYFKAKDEVKTENFDDLSPMLRMFIQQERQMKALQEEVSDTKTRLEHTQTETQKHAEQLDNLNGRFDAVSYAIKIDSKTWRTEVASVVRKICRYANDAYPTVGIVYGEMYKLLELRGKCNLQTRLVHKQSRMREAGVSMSKVKQVNRLDIIAEDPCLTEIFIAIVREYAIKFGIHSSLVKEEEQAI